MRDICVCDTCIYIYVCVCVCVHPPRSPPCVHHGCSVGVDLNAADGMIGAGWADGQKFVFWAVRREEWTEFRDGSGERPPDPWSAGGV